MPNMIKAQIILEEGKELHKYKCTRGHWTIGIGHNLDTAPKLNGWTIPDTITETECNDIFLHDLACIVGGLNTAYPNIATLSDARRDALYNMAFQMGVAGVMKFSAMFAALDNADWQRAKAEALDSAWAKQTPQRAYRVAHQLMIGEYYKV